MKLKKITIATLIAIMPINVFIALVMATMLRSFMERVIEEFWRGSHKTIAKR
jgi:hypothetical protein